MELVNRDKRDGYIYDPIIKGYDTSFFASITGTPAISSSKIRFNVATAGSYILHEFADIEFSINVPVKPTAGDSRRWGFFAPATTALGAIYFDITGTAFTAVSIDEAANTNTSTLTWTDGTFSNAQIKFRIVWEHSRIQFWVNGSIVATHSAALSTTYSVPQVALPVYIKNGNADNMDVAYFGVRRAAGIV